jgi:hypothetical protein
LRRLLLVCGPFLAFVGCADGSDTTDHGATPDDGSATEDGRGEADADGDADVGFDEGAADGAPDDGPGDLPPDDAPADCPCLAGVDNFCLYPHDTPGCAMLLPGGTCDPDGDGDFDDADWEAGWYAYRDRCTTSCGDGSCGAGESCTSCTADCGTCPPGCPDGSCGAGEDCASCPADCGTCPPACGNGTCDTGENCLSCAADCPRTVHVSCGKLGAQTIGDTAPFYDFLAGCPRVAKWIGGAGSRPGEGFAQFAEMAAYKCSCGGITVLRVYGPATTFATGADLWAARYGFLESAEPWQKAAVDYLESDNECDAGHCWFRWGDPSYTASPEAAADYAAFLEQWIVEATAHGFTPLVGNMSVGSPGGDIDRCDGDGARTFAQLVPAFLAARDAGGAWGYHGYTAEWSTSATDGMMSYLPFRYRKLIACAPDLALVPLILTEAGWDTGGNPDEDGYLTNGDWAAYGPWLAWYDGELGRDAYVRGATLFAFAPPGSWSSFRLDDHAADLRGLLGAASCTP